MKKNPTKQRILREGLRLFAERGYKAVSVEQIAAAVGIKAPSLYKHFESKKAIFQAILDEMQERNRRKIQSLWMKGEGADKDVDLFLQIGEEQLLAIGKELFLYFLHDEYFGDFRKLLSIGQYADPEIAALFARQCITGPLDYDGQLFAMMIEQGFFIQASPQVMALHFYAPVYMLLMLCDCYPDREEECLKTLEEHIRQFNQLYVKEKETLQ